MRRTVSRSLDKTEFRPRLPSSLCLILHVAVEKLWAKTNIGTEFTVETLISCTNIDQGPYTAQKLEEYARKACKPNPVPGFSPSTNISLGHAFVILFRMKSLAKLCLRCLDEKNWDVFVTQRAAGSRT